MPHDMETLGISAKLVGNTPYVSCTSENAVSDAATRLLGDAEGGVKGGDSV